MLVVAFTLDGFGLLRFQFSCFSYLGVRTFTQVFMKRECIGLMKALQTSIVMWALNLVQKARNHSLVVLGSCPVLRSEDLSRWVFETSSFDLRWYRYLRAGKT